MGGSLPIYGRDQGWLEEDPTDPDYSYFKLSPQGHMDGDEQSSSDIEEVPCDPFPCWSNLGDTQTFAFFDDLNRHNEKIYNNKLV